MHCSSSHLFLNLYCASVSCAVGHLFLILYIFFWLSKDKRTSARRQLIIEQALEYCFVNGSQLHARHSYLRYERGNQVSYRLLTFYVTCSNHSCILGLWIWIGAWRHLPWHAWYRAVTMTSFHSCRHALQLILIPQECFPVSYLMPIMEKHSFWSLPCIARGFCAVEILG